MENKQTSIDWLMEQITYDNGFGKRPCSFSENKDLTEFFEQARQMHREEIEKANIAGMEFIPVDPNRYKSDASDYYTQIYGQ